MNTNLIYKEAVMKKDIIETEIVVQEKVNLKFLFMLG